MKKAIFTLVYLLMPSALIFTLSFPDSSTSLFLILAVLVYFVTVTGLFLYFKFFPCVFLAPLFGLLMSPSFVFVYERNLNSYFFSYLLTAAATIYYALPLALVFTIVFITIKIKREKDVDI